MSARLEMIYDVLLGRDRHAVAGSRAEMPVFESGKNFGIDHRPQTLHNGFAHDIACLVDGDLDDDVALDPSTQIVRANQWLRSDGRQSGTDLVAGVSPFRK
jgi:hypothetical protein